MSESVIADFVGTFNAETMARGEPVAGRILLSGKRLVLAADNDTRLQIPLSSIFDVAVGYVPEGLGDFFDSTVTVAFERNDRQVAAAIEAEDDTIEKFSTVLFKAILNGTEATVKHPARRGGRVTDREFEVAGLSVGPRAVTFENDRRTVTLDLPDVVGLDRVVRRVDGERRPVLQVRNLPDGDATTTAVTTRSHRLLTILGRCLRLEYGDRLADVADVDLTDEETETLVAVYAGAGRGGVSLADVLDVEPSEASSLLSALAEVGLVEPAEEARLTPEGHVAATARFGEVDS